MIRSKLYVLISAFSVGKDIKIDREASTFDDMIKELQEIAHNLHASKNFMSAQKSVK